jgi:hypothetical protein
MRLTFEGACQLVDRLGEYKLFPGLDPYYVKADSFREPDIECVFYSFEHGRDIFYLAAHKSPVPGTDRTLFDIQSPYGYGGAISTTVSPTFLKLAWEEISQGLANEGVIASFFRYHPIAINDRFALTPSVFNRKTVGVDVTGDFRAQYRTRVRTAIKKAAKDLSLTICTGAETDSHQLWQLYSDAMVGMDAQSFYFFNQRYFEELVKIPSFQLIVARQSKTSEIVGFACFFSLGTMTEYHLAGVTPLGRTYSAANLILDAGLELAKKNGSALVHLGGGRTQSEQDSLLFFKEGFSDGCYEFRIGGEIFDKIKYGDLKQSWTKKLGELPSRVLFYR